MNKRRTPRFSLKLPTKVIPSQSNGQEALEFITEDVSSSGLYISTNNPLEKNAEVIVDLILPLDQLKEIQGNRVHIKVSGLVVRSSANGMGISFDEEYEISAL